MTTIIHLRGNYANRELNLISTFSYYATEKEKKKKVENIHPQPWSDISLTDPSKGSKIINSIRHREIQLKNIHRICLNHAFECPDSGDSTMDPVADPVIPAEIYPHAANKSSNQIDIWVMGAGMRRNWFSAASKSRPRVRNETTMGWRGANAGRVKAEDPRSIPFGDLCDYFLSSIPRTLRREEARLLLTNLSFLLLPLLHEDPWILMRPT